MVLGRQRKKNSKTYGGVTPRLGQRFEAPRDPAERARPWNRGTRRGRWRLWGQQLPEGGGPGPRRNQALPGVACSGPFGSWKPRSLPLTVAWPRPHLLGDPTPLDHININGCSEAWGLPPVQAGPDSRHRDACPRLHSWTTSPRGGQ
ncbi:hypothetical protein P7K49_030735 [Saguinus oedipus]|uniref:Uncharacterized protein n=1 Tax=Saguinus oedipus TaxID=9490 RepID=A0ABQ9U353_SAGOE|nr:hypothetical protein P7K49_030735 [Saguinus oedipus]